MQVRIFRSDEGTFDIVVTPRKRTGLVPLFIKGLDKSGVITEVQKATDAEKEVLETIRAAARAVRAP